MKKSLETQKKSLETQKKSLETQKKSLVISTCKDCKWHDEFSWACCNGDSEYRADFVNCGCIHKSCVERSD